MNLSWLTLRDLQYLVAVADSAHFGKAAAACHVSQPALSAQIRKVENVLDVQLFERSNRRVAITPAGEAVVRQAGGGLGGGRENRGNNKARGKTRSREIYIRV